MKTIVAERCDVCGRKYLRGLFEPCVHPPEEHAKAAMAKIMKRHRPALIAALRCTSTEIPDGC